MEPGDAVGHVEQLSGIGDLDEQRVVAIDLHVADRDGLSARIHHGPILRRELHGPPSAGLRPVVNQYSALRHAISQWLGGGVEDAVGGRIDQEQTGEGDVVLDSGRVTLNRYVPMVNGPWATRHDAQPTPERGGRSADGRRGGQVAGAGGRGCGRRRGAGDAELGVDHGAELVRLSGEHFDLLGRGRRALAAGGGREPDQGGGQGELDGLPHGRASPVEVGNVESVLRAVQTPARGRC